jgi:hypothetical protein
MATVPAPPPVEIITATFGPFVTGIMMQMMFMGCIIVQVYDYYTVFPKDSQFNKWLVGILTAICVLQTTMDYKILYRCSVEFYGNFDKFDDTDWSLWWEIAVTAIIGSIAQSFFLERCWSATKSYVVLGLGVVGILVSLGSGIASTIMFQNVGRLSRVPEIPGPITTWLVSTAVIDLAIAGILIWSLTRVKSRFRKTETIVARIIRLTFQTSALTAAIAIVNVILYLALPGEAYHLLPQLVMGKIYAMSVMVTLSSRTELRDLMNTSAGTTYIESTRAGNGSRGGATSKIEFSGMTTLNNNSNQGIQVNTTTYVEGDGHSTPSDAKLGDVELGRQVPTMAVSGPFSTPNGKGGPV